MEGERDKARVEKERQDTAAALEKLNQDKKSVSLKEEKSQREGERIGSTFENR